jgi:hypothetical protein
MCFIAKVVHSKLYSTSQGPTRASQAARWQTGVRRRLAFAGRFTGSSVVRHPARVQVPLSSNCPRSPGPGPPAGHWHDLDFQVPFQNHPRVAPPGPLLCPQAQSRLPQASESRVLSSRAIPLSVQSSQITVDSELVTLIRTTVLLPPVGPGLPGCNTIRYYA